MCDTHEIHLVGWAEDAFCPLCALHEAREQAEEAERRATSAEQALRALMQVTTYEPEDGYRCRQEGPWLIAEKIVNPPTTGAGGG